MELALYCPRLGYYERQSKQIGCQGDFYTSVTVGNLFGELLAFQSIQWLDELIRRDGLNRDAAVAAQKGDSIAAGNAVSRQFRLVEAGAHNGQLALDILSWIQRFEPAWLDSLEYWILEPSAERQRWQELKLSEFAAFVRWFRSWESVAPREIHGVILSNEFVDAFPVRRIGWNANAQSWFEWGVGWAADRFVWERIPFEMGRHESPDALPQVPNELLAVLPEGFTTEIAPAAQRWWWQAARALGRGKLLTLDYGLTADEFFLPERAGGTLRAYLGHHCSGDLLARPGEQDLTAHIDFSALQRAGEAEGLITEGIMTQARFLTRILEQAAAVPDASFGLSRMERCRQFHTLTHPEHLGRPLKVLVQSRK
jgi:SAM-dependent MidA family methyltransferase